MGWVGGWRSCVLSCALRTHALQKNTCHQQAAQSRERRNKDCLQDCEPHLSQRKLKKKTISRKFLSPLFLLFSCVFFFCGLVPTKQWAPTVFAPCPKLKSEICARPCSFLGGQALGTNVWFMYACHFNRIFWFLKRRPRKNIRTNLFQHPAPISLVVHFPLAAHDEILVAAHKAWLPASIE